MNKQKRRKNRSGFTLIEILVVIIIIAALAAMTVPRFFGVVGRTKQSVAKQKLVELEKAVETFSYEYDRWPENLDELVNRPADIPEEKWQPPRLKVKDLIDPWERKFIYKYPGDNGLYDLYSLGKDGTEGGEEDNADVVNW